MDTMSDIPTSSSDIITQGIEFLKTYWDDIAIIVIIFSILFLYVLLSGIELKGISDDPKSIVKGVRKLLFPLKKRRIKKEEEEKEEKKEEEKEKEEKKEEKKEKEEK